MWVESATLPEFGLEVSWAMCRNTMCPNFGIPFEGEIAPGRQHASDKRYAVRLILGARGRPVGVIECYGCGQISRLASNRAIRPIARYFLSLSLPFADCPNTDCQNHGVNLFESWGADSKARPYRRTREHSARCKRCGAKTASGARHGAPSILLGTARQAADGSETRRYWPKILDALNASRSIADTTDLLGISHSGYLRHLARLGARLSDYHAFRNAHLLHPNVPNRERPVSLHSGVIDLSARLSSRRDSTRPLPVIVTVAAVGGPAFVVAAHPYFLPMALCPDAATLTADRWRPPLETEWDALQHPFADDPGPGERADRLSSDLPDSNPDGYRIRSPYAELAHFLVVQKMLSRFRTIHSTLDAADGLLPAALVAYRDRILAGRPKADAPAARPLRASGTAEMVLFSYDHQARRPKPGPSGPPPVAPKKSPDDAWWAAEKRFAEQPIPESLAKAGLSRGDPRVRATLFRRAFRGAYSKTGGWAWLHHPPETPAYGNPRTLWLTRTPHKTFERHGRALLAQASLHPLDSVFNEIRANVRSARRPIGAAVRTQWTASRPTVLLNELAIYLLLRNYGLRKWPQPPRIRPRPGHGLVGADEDKPDPADIAWRFRLGVEHAKQISEWRRG